MTYTLHDQERGPVMEAPGRAGLQKGEGWTSCLRPVILDFGLSTPNGALEHAILRMVIMYTY